MAGHVNLDALIPREDFDIPDPTFDSSSPKQTVSVTDLRRGDFLFSALRKPDFLRETSQWDSSKVVDFVESFLTGDLIPAVILWRNPNGYTFVIDGSHRLSSLAAWINDTTATVKYQKTSMKVSFQTNKEMSLQRLVSRSIKNSAHTQTTNWLPGRLRR